MSELIYRVEHADGLGVYQAHEDLDNESAIEFIGMEDRMSPQHPGPEGDAKLWPQWRQLGPFCCEYSFGFSTLEQTAQWFYRKIWLTRLDEIGVYLSTYDVKSHSIRHGDTQCIFDSEHATLVTRQKMITLWPYVKQVRNKHKKVIANP